MVALKKYFYTIRFLRLSQIGWLARNRLTPLRTVGAVDLGVPRNFPTRPIFLPPLQPSGAGNEFRFLNVARRVDVANMDWAAAGMSKLWRYNLHYCDWLHWEQLADRDKRRLIDSWIECNPQGRENAWEPYTLSLRVVNWIKYFLRATDPAGLPRHWLESLAVQVVWLTRNLEYHLLANHLLKNAKALFFGGAFFAGSNAERIRAQGLAMLVREAAEQILPDGGHYERSLMYHQIVLEDYLDALSLVNVLPALAGDEQGALTATAASALALLEGIVGGDGEIPLFNDAAHGIAASPDEMIRWGRRIVDAADVVTGGVMRSLVGTPRRDGAHGGEQVATGVGLAGTAPARIFFPQTGYFGYRHGGDSLIVDCGPVGPDHQPGHAHCDTLSFELCLDSRRIIVDSGTYDYEAGALRQQLRSTAAHNTVMVDDAEQSEVWGVFRVARRARPLNAALETAPEGGFVFRGAHDGYKRLPGRVIHHREIRMRPSREWVINDRLEGGGTHRAESRLHLHPELQAVVGTDGVIRITRDGQAVVSVCPQGASSVRIESGWYCPQFGVQERNFVLVAECAGLLPLEFGWNIRRLG